MNTYVSLMYELKIGKVFTSKFVRTGPSSYKKIIYRAAVSQSLRNTALHHSDKLLLNYYSLTETPMAQTPRYSALLPSQFSVEPIMPYAFKAVLPHFKSCFRYSGFLIVGSGKERTRAVGVKVGCLLRHPAS